MKRRRCGYFGGWLALVALSGTLVGCLAPQRRGVSLYRAEQRLPRERVALLEGPIQAVDGVDLGSSGNATFELLPGCHLVKLGGHIGKFDQHYGGYVAVVPPRYYALPMQAGASYIFELQPGASLGKGSTTPLRLTAEERNRQGRIRALVPIRERADVEACQRFRPATPASSN